MSKRSKKKGLVITASEPLVKSEKSEDSDNTLEPGEWLQMIAVCAILAFLCGGIAGLVGEPVWSLFSPEGNADFKGAFVGGLKGAAGGSVAITVVLLILWLVFDRPFSRKKNEPPMLAHTQSPL